MKQRTSPTKPVVTRTTIELPTTIGLDLSDRVSHFHVVAGDGQTLETGKVRMSDAALKKFFERWQGCRLVIETGTNSPWVSRLGTASGLETIVANARQLPLISNDPRKSDRNDARLLAETGCRSPHLLHPVVHRSAQAQADLSTLRARDQLVRVRTELINHVRGAVKASGERVSACSPESFPKKALAQLPAEQRVALEPLLKSIAVVVEQIKVLDQAIDRLCKESYPQTERLLAIHGVGPVTALTFVLTIDDVSRFKKARDVGAYLGMVPRSRSSGASNPQLHITKQGDPQMRRLSVLCANLIMQEGSPDCDLKRFGQRIAGHDGDRRRRKCAKVAVARKLLVLMLHLLKSGEVYDPLHLAKKRGDDELE